MQNITGVVCLLIRDLHNTQLRRASKQTALKGSWETEPVNPKLKALMKELGEAINESLSESEQISEVIAKIKAGGYDVFLVLEATIGFNKADEPASRKRSL